MSLALNLKYRPQKISELDQTTARDSLLKIFQSGKIPQVFLFSGPKGIGKTSSARIVAKAVNCEKVTKETKEPKGTKEFEPCNECPTCVSITNGTNLDILEIDGASNTGIDDVRELRDKIRLAPSSAKLKVYIIDEVHMLSTAAFNGLLKTLEEPPKHTLFILCTTLPEKLPETIISRCTRINFKKATLTEIINKLKKISKGEGFNFSEADLEKIAKMSGGSFRDAVKFLEQSSGSSVEEVLGITGQFNPSNFLELLTKREIKKALLWLNEAVEGGANLRFLTEGTLEILRGCLLAKYGILPEENKIEKVMEGLNEEEIKKLIELFAKAGNDLKTTIIPQLPLEMAVIEFGESRKCEVGGGKLDIDIVEVGSGKTGKDEEQSKNQNISPQSETQSRANPASHFSPLTSIKLEEVLTKWPEILAKVKPLNHSIQAFLKACRPVAVEGESLLLEVFYKFHKDQLESDKCRRTVEGVCQDIFGYPVRLKFQLSQKPLQTVQKVEELKVPVIVPELQEKKSIAKEDELIKAAEEIFGGVVVN